MQSRYLAVSLSLCLAGVTLAACAGSPAPATGSRPAQSAPGPAGAAGSAGSADGTASPASSGAAAGAANAVVTGHTCGLVPASVLNSVLGNLTSPPFETPNGPGCIYSPADGPTVGVEYLTRADYESRKASYQGAAKEGAVQFKPQVGLGDDAWATIQTGAAPAFQLFAVKGSQAVMIFVAATDAATASRCRQLMMAILASL
jgi:hypothetical protein